MFCIVGCRNVWNHTAVPSPSPSLSPSEQKIVDLCANVVSCSPDSQDFQSVVEELRAAIHTHLEATRDKLKEMALRAQSSGSSAAD
jgi:hypothetical protein